MENIRSVSSIHSFGRVVDTGKFFFLGCMINFNGAENLEAYYGAVSDHEFFQNLKGAL